MEKIVKILEKVAWVAAVVVQFVKALVSGSDGGSGTGNDGEPEPGREPGEGGETS